MKNNEIAIFSVSKTITQRISNVLIERKIDIPVYEFHYFDVVEKAQQLVAGGTKSSLAGAARQRYYATVLLFPLLKSPTTCTVFIAFCRRREKNRRRLPP